LVDRSYSTEEYRLMLNIIDEETGLTLKFQLLE